MCTVMASRRVTEDLHAKIRVNIKKKAYLSTRINILYHGIDCFDPSTSNYRKPDTPFESFAIKEHHVYN